jgi:hypothetical protein
MQTEFLHELRTLNSPVCKELFKSPPQGSSQERWSIYNLGYRSRLKNSLREDFPETLELMGEFSFINQVEDFIQKTPSRYWTLAEYSREFPEFLAQRQVSPEHSLKAKLEWAKIEARHQSLEPLLGQIESPENLVLGLSRGVRLVSGAGTGPVFMVFKVPGSDYETCTEEISVEDKLWLECLKNPVPLDQVPQDIDTEKIQDWVGRRILFVRDHSVP